MNRGGRGADVWSSGQVEGEVRDAGDDRHYGGPGSDHLEDFTGVDRLYGGPGDDRCLTADDDDGADLLDGGGGVDIWFSEFSDTLIDLERRLSCVIQ